MFDQENVTTDETNLNVDWGKIKIKQTEGAFEIQVPDLKTGRSLILAIAPSFFPSTSSLEERFKSEEPILDWRLNGRQTTFYERTEQDNGGTTHIVDLFVKNRDSDDETKLNTVVRSLLPSDYEVEMK